MPAPVDDNKWAKTTDSLLIPSDQNNEDHLLIIAIELSATIATQMKSYYILAIPVDVNIHFVIQGSICWESGGKLPSQTLQFPPKFCMKCNINCNILLRIQSTGVGEASPPPNLTSQIEPCYPYN